MHLSRRYLIADCLAVVLLLALQFGCGGGPKITKFVADPRTICDGDTIRANWEIDGTPTMLISMSDAAVDPAAKPAGEITPQLLTLTLVVHKDNHDDVINRVQVEMLPPSSKNMIAFTTTLRGDTLVAAGDKSFARWGSRFQIAGVASASDRQLFVRHGGNLVQLEKDGTPSHGLDGASVEGPWEILSLLTAAERKDPTIAPDRLKVEATIQCKINK